MSVNQARRSSAPLPLQAAMSLRTGTSMSTPAAMSTKVAMSELASLSRGASANPNSGTSSAPETSITVRDGDTLASIAQKALQARGLAAGAQVSMRTALQLARENGLANADLIFPGQKIDVSSLAAAANAREQSTGAVPGVPAGIALKTDTSLRTSAVAGKLDAGNRPAAIPGNRPGAPARLAAAEKPAHPVLEKTLDRAVSLRYFSASEKDAVRNKVLQLAAEHHFSPDDLAIVTLIESDGMNPKANNGRCHGLIQFCDGPNRGAASVGYKDNPKAILDLSVLDQLDLVGKYFEETGLKNFGKTRPASLDDLYLTVLTPAARRERGLNTDLDIAGQQATSLREGGDPTAPITRASLLQGLRQNARSKLSAAIAPPNRDTASLVRVSALDTKQVKSSL
ncbi:MAG: LysM domain-containing protein [Proteobacteria bacterium]|nr:LysM domain-containing protein [Pseudomonadota bacterium]